MSHRDTWQLELLTSTEQVPASGTTASQWSPPPLAEWIRVNSGRLMITVQACT